MPITISDLRLETHHIGRVLVVRTFCNPVRFSSVQNAIEDWNYDVDQLAIYNGDPKVAADHVLPKDTIFAIKEPYYKAAASGGYIVRVDHPSDLLKLQPTHPMVPAELMPSLYEFNQDGLKYKNIGNAAFKAKDCIPAQEAYTLGIDACGDKDNDLKRDLYRNRAIVNTYLHRYEQISKDALAAFIPDVANDEAKMKSIVKALYRAGRAFYCLEVYGKALSRFESLLKISPDDNDGLEQLMNTKARLEEGKTGQYDFNAMSESITAAHKRLDHASFTANVAVRAFGKKGRSLFASKAIKFGELVLVERAFAFESEMGYETHIVLNINTNTGRMGAHASLFCGLVQKALYNSTQAQRLLDLFDGGYSPKRILEPCPRCAAGCYDPTK